MASRRGHAALTSLSSALFSCHSAGHKHAHATSASAAATATGTVGAMVADKRPGTLFTYLSYTDHPHLLTSVLKSVKLLVFPDRPEPHESYLSRLSFII